MTKVDAIKSVALTQCVVRVEPVHQLPLEVDAIVQGVHEPEVRGRYLLPGDGLAAEVAIGF